jgi:hypothetical protein
MRSVFAESNWATMELFSNACSKTGQGSARAAKKYLPAMAYKLSFYWMGLAFPNNGAGASVETQIG